MKRPELEDTHRYYQLHSAGFRQQSSTFWHHDLHDFHDMLPEGKILEIGCATGVEAKVLGEWYDYLGIDITAEFLEIAREQNPGLLFQELDLYDLDQLGKNVFDGFWCAATLLHVPKEDIEAVLLGILGVLKPGAIGFISIKQGEGEELVAYESQSDLPPRFFAYYERNEFRRILTRAGFEVIDVGSKVTDDRLDPGKKIIWLGYYVQLNH